MSTGGRRARCRNVHIYDLRNQATVLGGQVLTGGVTRAILCAMVDIFLVFELPGDLKDKDGNLLPKGSHNLEPGDYFIKTEYVVYFEAISFAKMYFSYC